ncbi:voltage-gated potassium channel [Diplocarpon rosae]|nr:voltage-gated potassium channel [Diplocarpon rosae]
MASPSSSDGNETTAQSRHGSATPENSDAILTFGKFKLRGKTDDLPQDWWFASTAIPLMAATIGPLANVLSIAALVSKWRVTLPNNGALPEGVDGLGTPIKDPDWAIVLNAISLGCGFFGNFCLLLNFTQRIRYIIALPATIISWYFATGILIAITVAMNQYVPPVRPGETYSQGFWHAVLAAALYLIGSMILMVNMLGYFRGHYPQHFDLDDDQRTLILQTMSFFFWLAGGAAVFAKVCGLSYADALYFCDVTVLTVGFGDVLANNDIARGLVFPYSVIGIIFLGLMINSIRKFASGISKDNVIKKHQLNERERTFSRTQRAAGKDAHAKRANRRERLILLKEEKDRFNAMREIQARTHRFKQYYALAMSVFAFGILWCFGALVFMYAEKRIQNLTYFQSLYFCYVSLLTIGYGDLSPRSNAGKPFFIVWSLVAVPTMTILVSDMGNTVVTAINRGTFTLADWTVMPKEGVWHDFVLKHPQLKQWLEQRTQNMEAKKRVEEGFRVQDPDEEEGEDREDEVFQAAPLETSAEDAPLATEHDLARKLAIAIKKTANDLRADTPKKYSYEEWVEFTRLIRFSYTEDAEDMDEDEEQGPIEWDWIGEDSPMLADMSESEWILERLCESLNRYTRKQARDNQRHKQEHDQAFADRSAGQLQPASTSRKPPYDCYPVHPGPERLHSHAHSHGASASASQTPGSSRGSLKDEVVSLERKNGDAGQNENRSEGRSAATAVSWEDQATACKSRVARSMSSGDL